MDWTKVAIEEGLCAKTPECPEGLQYVLIRGLHAMGFQQATTETWELMRAALDAAVKAQTKATGGIYTNKQAAALCLQYRAEALEEAAKVAEHLVIDLAGMHLADCPEEAGAITAGDQIATAIRSLKDKPKEGEE